MTKTTAPEVQRPIKPHAFQQIPNSEFCTHCGKYKEDCQNDNRSA